MNIIRRYGQLILMSLLLLSSVVAQSQRNRRGFDPGSNLRLRETEFYFVEGEKFYMLEDYAKALVYFEKVLELDPNNSTAYYKIADVLSQGEHQNDLAKAATNIEQALKLEKRNKYFYLLAANIYNGLGRFEKAAQDYEQMIQEIPNCEEYLYELAAVYQFGGKTDEAVKTYTRAEAIFGISETSSLQKQKLLLDAGKTEEAIHEGERLINAFPDEERYVVGFADMLVKNGRRDVAISTLEESIGAHRSFWSTRMLLASLYRDTGKEEAARKLLLEIFESPNSDLHSKMIMLSTYNAELSQEKSGGVINTEKGSFAVALFEKLKSSYKEESSVYVLGGDLYLALGRDSDALEQYKQAIKLGSNNFEVWQNLIYLELGMRKYDEVITHSNDALELFPNQSQLYYLKGFACLRARKYNQAISSLEEARQRVPASSTLVPQVTGLLGDAYHAVGAFEKSDEAYEASLAADPNNDVVLNNYSYYLSLRHVNLEKAEKMAGQLIKVHPDNPTYLDTYAWVLYAKGKYRDARKAMEKALATGQASATHYEHYGDILYRLGEVDEAVRQWETARSMSATSELLDRKIANRKIYEQ